MAGFIADWAKKGQAGVHCGCCGKWIPDQIDECGAGWGLCDECADCTEQQVQPDKFQERCTFPNNYIICGAYSDGICKSPKGTCRLT
jgi:hypothetical protein